MKLYYELDLKNFKAWSGAVDTLNTLTYDQIEQLEGMLPDILGEEADETALNDLLWFETDYIAETLGFKNWEHLERVNNGDINQTYESVIKITKEQFDCIDRVLTEVDFDDDSEEMEELIDELGAAVDDEYAGFTFNFEDGKVITINICSGSSNYYVYAEEDCEYELDCEGFAKEIEFEIDDNTYICKFIIMEE